MSDLTPIPVRTKALDSVLTREDFFKMLQTANDGTDRAILCLGLIGLRASEIVAFKPSWCDMSNRTITVPPKNAKRGKGRVVPFGNIKVVSEIILSFVVIERRGINMSRVAVWARVKRMAGAAGIDHPVTPHGLRATGATFFAQAGWSITGLQNHFGWTQLKTAQAYIQSSGASAIRDMQDKGGNIL